MRTLTNALERALERPAAGDRLPPAVGPDDDQDIDAPRLAAHGTCA